MKPYGILGLFDTAPEIYHAAEKVRDAGFKRWDVYAPFPIHGMDEAMGLKRSKVPLFVFAGGIIGFTTAMLMVWYMNKVSYPLIVGGMPYYSPVFPFPVAYELTILLSAFGAFFGQFITNLLPQHYHPVMNYDKFAALTDDRFAIVIETSDPNFNAEETRALLERIGAKEVVEIPE
jgi:hypothetical protein